MKYNKILFLFIIATSITFGQQIPDLEFEAQIKNPKYSSKTTATIGIDASHNNLHKVDGGFGPFAKLMQADGYQLKSITKISKEELMQLTTFVIVNPIHSSNIGNWKRPITNAFDSIEINILHDWVKNGGSLLVIADHMPFSGATNGLAKAFGFEYEDGFVMSENQEWPPERYSKKQGNLYETPITKDIDSIAGFTGSALRAPNKAIQIASFPKTHKLLIPEVAWQFENNTRRLDTTGLVMGAIMNYEKGKVAFFTEAAMFTAQIVQNRIKVGFTSPRAPQNKQFVLNLMHWLDNGISQIRKD